jgi:hypothetical protein
MSFIVFRRAISQAGRRGFESRLPLHKISYLKLANWYDSTTRISLEPFVELSHGAFQHCRLCLPVLVFVNVDAVAGELSTDIGITFGLAELCYPRAS